MRMLMLYPCAGRGLQWSGVWLHGAVCGRHAAQLPQPELSVAEAYLDCSHTGLLRSGQHHSGQLTVGGKEHTHYVHAIPT